MTNSNFRLRGLALRLNRSQALRQAFYHLPLPLRAKIRAYVLRPSDKAFKSESSGRKDFLTALTRVRQKVDSVPATPPLNWEIESFLPIEVSHLCSATSLPDANLTTIDFWDTLVFRTRPAEGVKRETALHWSMWEWRARGFTGQRIPAEKLHIRRLEAELRLASTQGEARIREVFKACLPTSDMQEQAEVFVGSEVDSELLHTRKIKSTVELVARHEISIVSDHYFGASDLQKLIVAHLPELHVAKVVSSADFGLTKRDAGSLFSVLRGREDGKWIHIGDNDWSDISCARERGATPIRVSRTGGTSWNGHALDMDELARDLPEHLGQRGAGVLLTHLAVAAYGLTTFAMEAAKESGRGRVVYLSREGETLHQAHQQIRPLLEDAFGFEVETLHVPSSRSSFFFSSFGNDVEAAIEAASKQYPLMTAGTLASSMGLSADLDQSWQAAFGALSLQKPIGLWNRAPKWLRESTREFVEDQQRLVRRFLEEHDVDSTQDVLCDIGWRGTIQDSIERVLGQPFTGLYLGLRRPYNKPTYGSRRRGLVFDEPSGLDAPAYMDFVGHIERAFTVSAFQAQRFAAHGGCAEPVFSSLANGPGPERLNAMTAHWGEAVIAVARSMMSVGIFGRESSGFVRRVLQQWTDLPNAHEAEVWFGEEHSEEFGAGRSASYSKVRPTDAWLSIGGVSAASTAYTTAIWHQGYLAWAPVHTLLTNGGSET